MQALFHKKTKQVVNDFLTHPAHAILLVGPLGSGKSFTAQYLAAGLLDIPIDKVADHPYIRWIRDQDKGISIEHIRAAQTFMQLKVPGTRTIRRVLLVEQGETMSQEAQNAFLKLLEEPPADSVIIIATNSLQKMLPTIRSRTQHMTILPPTEAQHNAYFKDQFSPAAITKAYHMSEGYVGLMHALLTQDATHPLAQNIAVAKQLLSSSLFERLAQVDSLTKQKNSALLLTAMERACHAALGQTLKNGRPQAKRWTARLKAITQAQQYISSSTQPKLVLTNLMLDL